MHSLNILATLIYAVSAIDIPVSPFFQGAIGNANVDEIAGIEVRILEILSGQSYDTLWHTKGPANSDGFSLNSFGEYSRGGYRLTGDDASAVVWEYDTSISADIVNATWHPINNTLQNPYVNYDLNFFATFPGQPSLPSEDKKKRSTSDVWDNGPYVSAPSSDISVTVTQWTCAIHQIIILKAIDAHGKIVASKKGVASEANGQGGGEIHLTIPGDALYPVELIALAPDIGFVKVALSNVLPIKYAVGSGDNVAVHTAVYSLDIELCPPDYEGED